VNDFRIARDSVTIYVAVTGLANMKNAPMLDAFFQAQNEQSGVTTICVDLHACQGMDSTFMGLLVGTSAAMEGSGARLVVVNPSEICQKLLVMLGLVEVLPVIERVAVPELAFIELAASGAPVGTIQRLELIRKAHQALMGISAENQSKFAAFMTALEADMAKIRPR
jgi:anti-sigma B factor antagonist